MTSAINLMKEHYADSDYNLERFIRDMGYSKTLVNQKLQSLTGQSIGQFMRNYRLNVAKDTLTKVECDISVAEIAYAVGLTTLNISQNASKSCLEYFQANILEKIVHFTILLHLCTIVSYKKLCFPYICKKTEMQMYMKNTFLLLSWLILLPSGILANPIKEMLERIDKEHRTSS